jgi:hypothetical protein
MDEDRSETTEQVVKFPPKQQSSIPADEAGQAVIAKSAKRQNYRMKPATALWYWRTSLRCSLERPKIELIN